jgi:diguanylate cyclase (GGDEF)-like protein
MVSMRHRAGHLLRVRLWTMAVRNAAGEIVGAVKVFTDGANAPELSVEKNGGLLEELHGESRLPRRAAAEAFLQSQIDSCLEPPIECGLILIKLEALEEFQRGHGQEAAGAIVREVSRTLKDMMRKGDFLGRWGAGSFLAVLPGCGLGPLTRLSEQMKEAAGRVAISWWGDRLSLKVSAGAAFVEAEDSVERVERRLNLAQDSVASRADGKGAGE